MTPAFAHGRFPACAAPLAWLTVLALTVPAPGQTPPDEIRLKDYHPRSIFRLPETRVEKARYAAVDVHAHDYARDDAGVDRWVRTMDEVGLEKAIILSGATGARFDAVLAKYRRHPTRFEVWCGLDYRGFDEAGYGPAAVAELERCHRAGATGVGELRDKGRGFGGRTNRAGMHVDDPRLDPLFERCAELGLPVNIHVGEDQWMYEPMDQTNDGLMNAWDWRIPENPAVLGHDAVVATLDRAAQRHPRPEACNATVVDLTRDGGWRRICAIQ